MPEFVHYTQEGGVAWIRIDDGKRNALAPQVLEEIYSALDQAEADDAVVIMTGREGVFSAGFDLKVMKQGGTAAIGMLRSGYALTARVLTFPRPVIAACNGHSFAMGVFLMLAADHVIGSRGEFKISANEVAIGLTMPRVGAAMLEHRLTPSTCQRAIKLSTIFDPEAALQAGFFDELVATNELEARAGALAAELRALPSQAHATTKRRVYRPLVRRIRRSIPLDLFDAIMLGFRRARFGGSSRTN